MVYFYIFSNLFVTHSKMLVVYFVSMCIRSHHHCITLSLRCDTQALNFWKSQSSKKQMLTNTTMKYEVYGRKCQKLLESHGHKYPLQNIICNLREEGQTNTILLWSESTWPKCDQSYSYVSVCLMLHILPIFYDYYLPLVWPFNTIAWETWKVRVQSMWASTTMKTY